MLFSDFSLLLLLSSFLPPIPSPPFVFPPLFSSPFVVLTFEPSVSHIVGQHSTTELHPQLSYFPLPKFPAVHDFYKSALS